MASGLVCGVGWARPLTGAPLSLPGAEGLRVEFDRQCSTERRHDPLTVMDGVNRIVSVRSGVRGAKEGSSAGLRRTELLTLPNRVLLLHS